MSEQELYEIAGKLAALLISGAGGTFIFIKFWGQKWVENKFSKDLELFKVQKLHDFDLLLTRKTKWHEKEQEVLSTAWQKLTRAHAALQRAINALLEYPDFDRMSEQEFTKHIDGSKLSEDEKDYMRTGSDSRNRRYSKILEYKALQESHNAFLEFHQYFGEHRIFLRPHIKDKFEKVDKHIRSAWVSKKMSIDAPNSSTDFLIKAYDTENKEITPLIAEIEEAIQSELFPSEETNKGDKK